MAPCYAEQERERHQAAEPGRGGGTNIDLALSAGEAVPYGPDPVSRRDRGRGRRDRPRPGRTARQRARSAILAIVDREQPAASWIFDQDIPDLSIAAMPALRSTSSCRPLNLCPAFAFATPCAWRRRRSS